MPIDTLAFTAFSDRSFNGRNISNDSLIITMNTTKQAEKIDFDSHYSVEGYRGIAWSLTGYKTEEKPTIYLGVDKYGDEYEEEDWSETESVEDRSQVVAVMVGDDRKFTFDIEDVAVISEEEFCHECGQIGCGHGA